MPSTVPASSPPLSCARCLTSLYSGTGDSDSPTAAAACWVELYPCRHGLCPPCMCSILAESRNSGGGLRCPLSGQRKGREARGGRCQSVRIERHGYRRGGAGPERRVGTVVGGRILQVNEAFPVGHEKGVWEDIEGDGGVRPGGVGGGSDGSDSGESVGGRPAAAAKASASASTTEEATLLATMGTVSLPPGAGAATAAHEASASGTEKSASTTTRGSKSTRKNKRARKPAGSYEEPTSHDDDSEYDASARKKPKGEKGRASTDDAPNEGQKKRRKKKAEKEKEEEARIPTEIPVDDFSRKIYLMQVEWEATLRELLEHRDKTGSFDAGIPRKSKLGRFSYTNRQYYLAFQKGVDPIKTAPGLWAQRMEKLKSVGFLFPSKKEKWEQGYEELKAYHERHGHCLVPTGKKDDPVDPEYVELSKWCAAQRTMYRSRQMGRQVYSEERIRKLDSLGFTWRLSEDISNDQKWHRRYRELVAFREANGHCNVPNRYAPNRKLGEWVSTQRVAFKAHFNQQRSPGSGVKRGVMSAERVRLLTALGFSWDNSFAWHKQKSRLSELCKESERSC